jgi:hypothetical protein
MEVAVLYQLSYRLFSLRGLEPPTPSLALK